MGLNGVVEKKIDSKGRLSIPKKLRDFLAPDDCEEITLLKLDNCIQLYPNSTWSSIQNKIESLSPFDSRTRQLQRFWGMNADQLSIDAEGRIILSKDQKLYAEIDTEVVLVGAINKVEIWSSERWQQLMSGAPKLEEVAGEVSDLI